MRKKVDKLVFGICRDRYSIVQSVFMDQAVPRGAILLASRMFGESVSSP